MARLAYSTDPTDAQWALIEPFLQVWKAKRVSPSGYTGCYDLREIINALVYQNRTGCQWHLLFHESALTRGRAALSSAIMPVWVLGMAVVCGMPFGGIWRTIMLVVAALAFLYGAVAAGLAYRQRVIQHSQARCVAEFVGCRTSG